MEEAKEAIKEIMVDKKFGDSGNSIVIEEFMTGPEVSILCFCDGKDIVPMVSAQDHKRAFDGDKGLNTGGMGTVSPTRFYTEEISKICMEKIYKPTMDALIKEGRPFKGVIFFGLMITEDGPKVIEYNARFGDPETQVVLPRLKTDLVEIMEACIDGRLSEINIEWEDNATACVIIASGGYPNLFNKGYEIIGLEEFKFKEDIYVYHAGTPETQVVLPRLKTDLVEIMEACIDGRLSEINIEWEDNATACVIIASGGYPNSFNKGYEIIGLEEFKFKEDIYVYHAGTKFENGRYVTNGGRVLGIMAKGENLDAAKKLAYEGVSKIKFENMHFRKDIGDK